MKNFECKGVWWTKQHSDRVRGTLSFSGEDGFFLDVDGCLGEPSFEEDEDTSMIWGITDKMQSVTLVASFKTKYTMPIPGLPHICTEQYRVTEAYIGVRFEEESEIRFRKVHTSFNYLPQWVDVSGLDYKPITDDQGELQGHEIVYSRPEKRIFELPDDCQVCFGFGSSLAPGRQEVTLRQTRTIQIISPETLSLREWVTRYLSPLQDLLTLATLRPNSITELSGEVELPGEQPERVHVEMFFHQIFHDKQEPAKLVSADFLFRFQDVEDDFQDIISNWFKFQDDRRIVLRIFFGIDYQNHTFLDRKLVNVAQAAEIYHRARHNKTQIPQEEWKERIKTVTDSVERQELKKWVQEKLERSNELTLRERIRDLLNETDDVMNSLVTNKDKFAAKIVHTRNYFTHFSEGLRDKAATGKELYWLTEVLIIMMHRCFLKELGVPSDKCVELFRRNSRYKQYLDAIRACQFSWCNVLFVPTI